MIVEHSPNIVFSINRAGEIVYANRQAQQLMSQHAMTMAELTRLLPPNFSQIHHACLSDGSIKKEIESSFGEAIYLWTFSPFAEQHVLHCYAADVTERKKAREALVRQANIDAVTGLPNRNLALDRLAQAITRAHRNSENVCVMFIDLDRFKTVNDSFGHNTGDTLLKQVAQRLRQCVREGDTVARIGGDEFLIILDGVQAPIKAEPVAEQILAALGQPFVIDRREFYIGASIGIADYPDDGDTPLILLRNADSAMYQAKESGRNAFRFFTQALNDEAIMRIRMESCLRHALENNELHLEYQPQICAHSGAIVGAEALARWHSPQLGHVSPALFIPLAEDTGLIDQIGAWVLNSVCADLKRRPQNAAALRIAINISSRQLRANSLPAIIQKALTSNGIQAEQLELEITESLLMDNSPRIHALLHEIRSMGITLSLDDFGTGYSSLSYLKRYPFDALKIDRSFVRDISSDPDDAAVCEAIIAIADSLAMKVVGEGVENQEQWAFLFSRGVDLVQGNYYSKPLKSDEFYALFEGNKETGPGLRTANSR